VERPNGELKRYDLKPVWFIGTVDCDMEGKIARRFIQDIIDRRVDRSNVIKINDLEKLELCQVLDG